MSLPGNQLEMLNYQCSRLNECLNAQCRNSLNHYFIDHSLPIEHCPLNIAPEGGLE